MTQIQQKYWTVMSINFLITFLLAGGLITAFTFLPDMRPYQWYVFGGFVLLMGIMITLQKRAFYKRSYAIRERDIIYRRGLLSTNTTIIPFTRIQHVALNEGFIARYYGLAQLQIYTAGGSSSDLKISGLSKEDAEKIKSVILLQIGKKEEENSTTEAERL